MSSPAQALPVSPARAWSLASLLFVAGFINYLDRAIVSVALPVIAVDLHLGPAAKGVLLSAFFWSYSLMQLPIGLGRGPVQSTLVLLRPPSRSGRSPAASPDSPAAWRRSCRCA